MKEASPAKLYALHLAVVAILFGLNFVLPDYHQGLFSRIMVLATFAMGYNILFGYTGLLSLGHAMFFAAGLYGAGLGVAQLGWSVPAAFAAGLACGATLSLVVGALALRTSGVAFMIVTMMFAQVFALAILYFSPLTGGDQGLVLPQSARVLNLGAAAFDLTHPGVRYMAALSLFAVVLLVTLAVVRSRYGRVLVAIRENEERTRMLGYDTFAGKLAAVFLSGVVCAAAGAAGRCCSAMSGRTSPPCNIRSCRFCGCCWAAPRRRSVLSSARSPCTTWSTSPPATPPPGC